MAKVGRNDPCLCGSLCGSGKTYKACCLAKDQDGEAKAYAAQKRADAGAREAARAQVLAEDEDAAYDFQLAEASNAIVDMVHAGRLDEAEAAARDVLNSFPEVHDGYDRLGMVYEARGDKTAAMAADRNVIDFIRTHPDPYDPGFEDAYLMLIEANAHRRFAEV